MKLFFLFSIFLFFFFSLKDTYGASSLPWELVVERIKLGKIEVEVRMGALSANPNVLFKGNILYYEGLADSMLNHDPLFERLSAIGYQIVAFDYMGQGGSSGTMNQSTLKNINELGDLVINRLGRKNGPFGNKYHIIGWSTGGLAAYRKAYKDKENVVQSVVLIAPGLAPKLFVGEGLFHWPIDEITIRTLTNNKFIGVNNPHQDRIRPRTPLAVPKFSFDLQRVAFVARNFWSIPRTTPGLVLLSGTEDTYVNAKKTKKVLRKKAPHFDIYTYKYALHEIDNEIETISSDACLKIVAFLDGI